MGSSSVVGKAFLMAIVLISFTVLSFAVLETYQQSCADGTKYGKCSTASPGKMCSVPSPPVQYAQPVLKDAATLCPCPAGYLTNADVCEKQTCSDGTGYNECSKTIGKTWYRCENGVLTERASACACPTDYHKDGEKCAINDGCLYNKPTCPPDKYCDAEKTNATYNMCVKKAGCQYGNPACTESQTCESNGACKLKSGCKYNNPGCNLEKEICRASENKCVAKSAFDSISAGNIANAATTNATSDSSSSNPLQCCCPSIGAGLITLTGAFVIGKKKDE